jgi:hypothetical protein
MIIDLSSHKLQVSLAARTWLTSKLEVWTSGNTASCLREGCQGTSLGSCGYEVTVQILHERNADIAAPPGPGGSQGPSGPTNLLLLHNPAGGKVEMNSAAEQKAVVTQVTSIIPQISRQIGVELRY